MAKQPGGSSGSGFAGGQAQLTAEQIRAVVMAMRATDDTNPCQTLLEKVLEGLGEFGSIRNLLPAPKDLDKRQKAELARIRAECARVDDPGPLHDLLDEDSKGQRDPGPKSL